MGTYSTADEIMKIFNLRYAIGLTLSVLALPLLNACEQSTSTETAQASVAAPTAIADQTAISTNATASTAAPATSPAASTNAAPAVDGSQTNQAVAVSSLALGDYCYERASNESTAHAKITVSNGNQLSGQVIGKEHNEAASYFTSVGQDFQGTLTGDQAKLDITTVVEGETRTSQEVWTMTANQLQTDYISLQEMNCAQFGQLPEPPNAPGSDTAYVKPTNKRISFAAGASSTVISDAAVRGEWHTYLINAGENQMLSMNITAVEDNATFEVTSPSGQPLSMDSGTTLNQVLPETGDYQISVGPTRGNASYEMSIEIR